MNGDGGLETNEAVIARSGIKEVREIAVNKRLTPIDQITPDLLTKIVPYGFGRGEEQESLTETQAQLALASLQVYRRYMEEERQAAVARHSVLEQEGSHVLDDLRTEEHIGENPLIVGSVRVSPMDPGSPVYTVSFTATNIDFERDQRTQSSALLFNNRPRDLNDGYPARMEGSWIVGKRAGQTSYEIVGRYRDLHNEGGGLIIEMLQERGYVETAEISPMMLNHHTGFLKGSKPEHSANIPVVPPSNTE